MIKLKLFDGRPSITGTDGTLWGEGVSGGGALTGVGGLGTGTGIIGGDEGLGARLGGDLRERGALCTRYTAGVHMKIII